MKLLHVVRVKMVTLVMKAWSIHLLHKLCSAHSIDSMIELGFNRDEAESLVAIGEDLYVIREEAGQLED